MLIFLHEIPKNCLRVVLNCTFADSRLGLWWGMKISQDKQTRSRSEADFEGKDQQNNEVSQIVGE
jgi:hypothetical protein